MFDELWTVVCCTFWKIRWSGFDYETRFDFIYNTLLLIEIYVLDIWSTSVHFGLPIIKIRNKLTKELKFAKLTREVNLTLGRHVLATIIENGLL